VNGYLKIAAIAAASYAVIALFQQKVMTVPVIGGYLPR
jgi:hypothetical protein